MSTHTIVKPKHTVWKTVAAGLVMLLLIILIRLQFGADPVFLAGALLMLTNAFWSLVLTIRMRNRYFIVGFLASVFLLTANCLRVFYSETVAEYFLPAVAVFGIWWILILATRKVRIRVREMLILAAEPVSGRADGFTSRPYPAGRTACSEEDIRKFGRFLQKHLLALSFTTQGNTLLLLEYSYKQLLFYPGDISNLTYVMFSAENSISVHISAAYYKRYTEKFTFDQLCGALGNLFISFLELYRKGDGVKILERLDSVPSDSGRKNFRRHDEEKQ